MNKIYVVDLIDESDELLGYGVCVEDESSFQMRPDVHATRSTAHSAAALETGEVQ